jgi:hypothetical protein
MPICADEDLVIGISGKVKVERQGRPAWSVDIITRDTC